MTVKTASYGHQLFPFNDWFDKSMLKMSAVENVRYQICIHTGNSGPNFKYGKNVQLQIVGDLNRTHYWNMGYSDTHPNDGNRFNK